MRVRKKKSVEADAVRVGDVIAVPLADLPLWLANAFLEGLVTVVGDNAALMVSTPDGGMRVELDDWIIHNVIDGMCPVKSAVFDATYDVDDQAEPDGFALVMPFVVCQSKGGPYDDASFVAGWQAGEIDRALTAAEVSRATRVEWDMVHAALVPQLELIAMRRGFPSVTVESSDEWPEWCTVTFACSESG